MAISPAIGVVLVLVGLALFLVDLSVTNHGLPTAGAIVALLAGGMALVVAGVPYSGAGPYRDEPQVSLGLAPGRAGFAG